MEDCWLCPISLQYDKVIETESYVNELLGNPKEKERLVLALLYHSLFPIRLFRNDSKTVSVDYSSTHEWSNSN